jgi:hypothetical protein
MTISPEELAAVAERHPDIPQDALPLEGPQLEWPPAVQHLNYLGRLGDQLGQVLGPMLQSDSLAQPQYLTVVSQEYDPESDRTRLGFTYGLAVPSYPEEGL